jgi:hypothetical protein
VTCQPSACTVLIHHAALLVQVRSFLSRIKHLAQQRDQIQVREVCVRGSMPYSGQEVTHFMQEPDAHFMQEHLAPACTQGLDVVFPELSDCAAGCDGRAWA